MYKRLSKCKQWSYSINKHRIVSAFPHHLFSASLQTMIPKKRIFLFILILSSAHVFAGIDTVVVPIQRQLLHERIRMEQTLLDRADGRADGMISLSPNEEVNKSITEAMINRINRLTDSIELNDRIASNNEKLRYLIFTENLLSSFRYGWKNRQLNPAYAGMLVNSFEQAMNANIPGNSIAPIIDQLPYDAGKIITTIFNNNPGNKDCLKILYLKFSALHPDRILENIEPYINESFADSMVVVCSRFNPASVYTASQATGTAIGRLIQHNENPLVKAIIAISKTTKSLLYFPFLDNLLSGKITIEDIKKYSISVLTSSLK